MHFLILTLLVLGIIFGPGIWVKRIMARYSKPEDRYPGTGGELARLLLDQLGLEDVLAEETSLGDHYDPEARAVRLTPEKFHGRSLTAVTVAAHEVGHAMQDRDAYPPLRWRSRLVYMSRFGEKLGAGLLLSAPFIGLITRAPAPGVLLFLAGFLTLGLSVLVHLATLPTEFDASFARALPMLERGGYLRPEDEPHARRLLQAAALTYVAGSLASLLNVARWFAILRR